MAKWTDLSPELRDIILEKLVNLYNNDDRHHRGVKERWEATHRGETPPSGIEAYASVSREWQAFIEKETFRNLTLSDPGNRYDGLGQYNDILDFGIYVNGNRRRYVKHIQLMVEVRQSQVMIGGTNKAKENGVAFTKQVRNLLDQLSAWETEGAGGLTFELGVHDGERGNDPPYFRYLNTGVVEMNELGVSRISKLAREYYYGPVSFDRIDELYHFRQEYFRGLHVDLLDFHARQRFPQVEVITKLLVRLEYFRPISPQALVTLTRCFPRLETAHIEQWRRLGKQDRWPSAENPFLTPSVKTLTLYWEQNIAFWGTMGETPPPQITPTDLILRTSLRLENMAVSFLIRAEDFFAPTNPDCHWPSLTSLALTSPLLISTIPDREDDANALFLAAAKAALKMPKLRLLEIWHSDGAKKAGIFRYQVTDTSVGIAWLGTWALDFDGETVKAWEAAAEMHPGGRYPLGVTTRLLREDEVGRVGAVVGLLKLRKLVLHEVSACQV